MHTLEQVLKVYRKIRTLRPTPIIYGSTAYLIHTKKSGKVHDLDVLVPRKSLPMIAQRFSGTHYPEYDTVHARIGSVKIEFDAQERWAPKRCKTKKIICDGTPAVIVDKDTLIWFYKQGEENKYRQKLAQLIRI